MAMQQPLPQQQGGVPSPPPGFVLDQAQSAAPPPPPPGFVLDQQQTMTQEILSPVNHRIARFLGAPVDIANAALGLVGLGSEEPVGGSQQIERGMRAVGIASGPSKTPGGRILEEIGAAAPGLVVAPLMAGIRGAGAVATALRGMGETAKARPIATAAAEFGGAASAGAGASLAMEAFPEDPVAEVLGALAGGFGLPAVVTLTRLPGRVARGVAQSQLKGFKKKGAKDIAARRLQQLAAEAPEAGGVEGAVARLRTPDVEPTADLTAAQITGNRRLLDLERAVIRKNATIEGQYLQRYEDGNSALRQEVSNLKGSGDVEATRAFITQRRDYVLGLMGERAKRAEAAIREKLTRLGPDATPEQASRVVAGELDSAYADALTQSEQLWSMVPMGNRVQADNTRAAIQETLDNLGKFENIGDLPDGVRRLIKKVVDAKGKVSLQPRVGVLEEASDLHKLRLRLLEAERKLIADPTSRIALGYVQRLQKAILRDLGAAKKARGDLYDVALDFSEQLDHNFRQGTVGKLLGFKRTGEPSVPRSLILQGVLAPGGSQAGLAADDLLRAVSQADAVTRNQIGEFLKGSFAAQATTNGRVDPAGAARFLQRNAEVLEQFPDIRVQMQDAVQSQALADRYATAAERATKTLHDRRLSRASLFLDAAVDTEVQAVLRSDNPRQAAKAIRRMAARDPSGAAGQGLKASFVEYLLGKAGTGKFGMAGGELTSGQKLHGALNTKAIMAVADEWLSPDEIGRLKRIMRTFERLETAQGRIAGLDTILDPASVPILEFALRTMGARLGAKAGAGVTGASLKTASLGSERFGTYFRKLTDYLSLHGPEKLLIDSVQDRDLMLALLQHPTDKTSAGKAALTKLNAWLVAEAGTAANATLEDEQP